jgi:hypothetical protein
LSAPFTVTFKVTCVIANSHYLVQVLPHSQIQKKNLPSTVLDSAKYTR